MKTISILLCLALTACPINSEVRADPAPEPPHWAAGCAVVITGIIIIWGLRKLCKMLPPGPPAQPPPHGTNQPPHEAAFALTSPGRLDLPDVSLTISTNWQMTVTTFQSSTNLVNWHDEYTVTNWYSPDQLVSVCASNGVPLQTNFLSVRFTNDVIFNDFSAIAPTKVSDKVKLWRCVESN